MSIFFSSSGNYFIAMKKSLCYITSSFPLGISGSAKLGAVSKELQRAVYLVKFFIVMRKPPSISSSPILPSISMKAIKAFQFSAFLRALFLIFSAAVCTAILAPLAIVSCLLDPSGRWPSRFQRTWGNWLLRTNGSRLRPKGLEHLEKGQAYIFVANHSSILDIPGIISASPLPVRFIAKKSLVWFPIFGWFLSLAGHILIDRENAKSALLSLKKAAALLKNGISIVVFPEGTRTPDGQVKDFKGGAFLLALQSKAPIVPVSISGTYHMLPRTGWCFWPGVMELILGKPITTHNLSLREARPLMKRVREIIMQNLKN